MVRLLPWLVVAVTALVFLPALACGFVWDDQILVVENQLTTSWANLPAIVTSSLWSGTPLAEGDAYYRPLMVASLLADRSLFGLSPAGYHAHSLLWHLLAVALAWRLLARWLPAPAAAAGLALFAVHPLQVEPVTFIAARNDPMAAALLLAGLLALCRDALSWRHLLAGAAAILAAALCKESVLLAPLLYAAVEVARTGRPGTARGHLAVVAALAIAVGARSIAGVGLPERADSAHLLAAAPPMLAFYAERLLAPVHLLPGLNLGWPPPTPWWSLAAAVILLSLALWVGRRAALVGVLVAGLALAPAAPAVAHIAAIPDRYAYLSMLGLGMALGACVKGRGLAVALVLWLVLGALSSQTLPSWRDDVRLWSAAHAQHNTAYTAGILGRILEAEGRLDEAAALYAQATAGPRVFQEACFSVTAIHLRRSDAEAAVRDGQRALRAGCARSAELLAPLAVALARLDRWEEAETLAGEIDADPTGLAVVVRVAAGRHRGDDRPLQQALRDHPDADPEALERAVQWLMQP